MSDFALAQEFARMLDNQGQSGRPVTLRQAVVAGIEMGSVSVVFADGTFPAGGVNFLDSYHPVIGDTVWIAKNGRDTLILGKIVIPGGLEQDPIHYVGDTDHGEPAFLNNWQNYGNDGTFTYDSVGFYKDPDGWVHLSGLIKNTSGSAADSVMFTLPTGYRPDYEVRVPESAAATGYAAVMWPIQVDTNGNVHASNAGAYGNIKNYLSLDGVRFMADTGVEYERFHEWTPIGKMGAWVWDSDVQDKIFPGTWQRWDGLVRCRGRFKSGTTDQIGQLAERACKRRWNVMFPTVGVAAPGTFGGFRIDMTPHTRSLDRISSSVNDDILIDGLQWFADVPESYWTPLAGANSWVRHSTVEWVGPRFFKDGYGVVHVKGLIKNGSTVLNTAVTEALPPDCRPMGRRVFASWSNLGSTRLDVDTDGTIRVVDTTAGNGFITLDPISFRANEVYEF